MHHPVRILLISVIAILAAVSFCSKVFWPKPLKSTISTGMTMSTAVSVVDKRGLHPQQMDRAMPHQAFDLPDGRTVVLIGIGKVDEIEVILNPRQPKAGRISQSVRVVTF